jgi:peptidoglycan/xylan/chitin deacetylase (PgdA/CDA1 family)
MALTAQGGVTSGYTVIERAAPLLIATVVLVGLVFAARGLGNSFGGSRRHPYIFPGLEGPHEATLVRPLTPASWRTYDRAGSNSLAILLTDTGSAWLGLARGLATIGVPFTITTDWHSALTHRVVWVYPRISGAELSSEALRAIGAVPRNGGTLIGNEIIGGGLEEVFGFDSVSPSRGRGELRFGSVAATRFNLADDFDKTIRIGSTAAALSDSTPNPGSYGYHGTNAEALATFDDGTLGLLHRAIGAGHAYAFGVDIGALLRLGYDNREEGRLARSYDNGYEPTLDVLLRVVRAIYTEGEPDAVTIGTVPNGRAISVILTHDIDFAKDWPNAVTFARFEKSQGIRATYFVQTKYLRDYNDEIFYDSSAIRHVALLESMGMEIGSHTVAHSRQFAAMPMGDGKEMYPAYQPFVQDKLHTLDATILGEIRVSKFLLEHATTKPILSFRPGYLSDPFALPEALEATAFRYSSSTTANNSLTHLPFRLTYHRSSVGESSIFEFPVTVEDEALPPMNQRLGAALALAKRIATYGGIYVLLTHPNVTAEKLEFERQLVAQLGGASWVGSMDQFGAWWAARDDVRLQVTDSGDVRTLELSVAVPLDGLSLTVPASWTLTTPNDQIIQTGQVVVIRHAQDKLLLNFRKS